MHFLLLLGLLTTAAATNVVTLYEKKNPIFYALLLCFGINFHYFIDLLFYTLLVLTFISFFFRIFLNPANLFSAAGFVVYSLFFFFFIHLFTQDVCCFPKKRLRVCEAKLVDLLKMISCLLSLESWLLSFPSGVLFVIAIFPLDWIALNFILFDLIFFFGIPCGLSMAKVMESFTFQLFSLLTNSCWLYKNRNK